MNNKLRSNFGLFGWMLVIYMMLVWFFGSIPSTSMNIASGVFSGVYGWNSTLLLSLTAIGGWIGVVLIYICGQLRANGKLNLRYVILVVSIIMGGSLMLWGSTTNQNIFVILFIFYHVSYSLWGYFANQSLCNNWFPRKRGLAIGWATFGMPLGSSIGMALFAKFFPILGGGNPAAGMGKCYMIIGICGIVIGVAAFFIFTEYPEQRGCFPDNDKSMTIEKAKAALEEGRRVEISSPWTAARMLTTKEVWLVSLSAGYMGMFALGSIVQVVPRLLAAGYAQQDATSMLSFTALCAIPGSYLIGLLDQRFGAKKALIVADVLACGACLLYTTNNIIAIWIALICIGVTLGGSSNFIMSITTNYWGRHHFKKAFGITLSINQIVANSGSMLVTTLASKYNYSVSYMVLAGLAIVSIVLILPVKDGFTKRYEEKFAAQTRS